MKGNSKSSSSNSLILLRAQNKDISTASLTLLTKVKLHLRRRLTIAVHRQMTDCLCCENCHHCDQFSLHFNLSALFVVSQILSTKVSPEWRFNRSFETQKKCPLTVNKGVPSTEFAYILKVLENCSQCWKVPEFQC